MVPHVSIGTSFKGVTAYLMNDVDPEMRVNDPANAKRVAWSETENLAGLDVEDAWRVMAMTAQNAENLKEAAGVRGTGRKASPEVVYHYSLSWSPDETPDDEHMKTAARETIAVLGLPKHQWFMVRHTDKDHAHIHIVVNLTDPENGKKANMYGDQIKLSKWAGRYERHYGIKCELRQENEKRREKGERTKYQSEKKDYARDINAAWSASDTGLAFKHALAEYGLTLAKGTRKRSIVVVDERGDIQALDRQLEIYDKNKDGVAEKVTGRKKGNKIREKIGDLELPDASSLSRQIKEDIENSREEESAASQTQMLDAAHSQARELAIKQITEQRRQVAHAEHLQKMEVRHARDKQILAQSLFASYAERIDYLKSETKRMRDIVKGRGVVKAIRRLWRGQKDRIILQDLRSEQRTIGENIKSAQDQLEAIQVKERVNLAYLYEQKQQRFKSLDPEKQIAILERLRKQPRFKKGSAEELKLSKARSSLSYRGPGKRARHISAVERERQDRMQARIAALRHQLEIEKTAQSKSVQEVIHQERAQSRLQELSEQPDQARQDRMNARLNEAREALNKYDKPRDHDP